MANIYFILNVVALITGPIIYFLIRDKKNLKHIFNYSVIVAIFLIVVFDIFPETTERVGILISIIAAYLGFRLVNVLDHSIHTKKSHHITVWLVTLGLSLHAITDGVALACNNSWLPIAVILHQIPVGAGIWAVLQSKIQSILVLSIINIATFIGFNLGIETLKIVDNSDVLAIFQATMSGSLMHIIMHENNKIHKWWIKKHPSHSEHCDI